MLADALRSGPPVEASSRRGLTDDEAARRRLAGQGNAAPPSSTRSYLEIVRENVFTFVNNVLFVLAAALAIAGRPLDGLVSLAVISTNIVVGVVQEVRAKRVLDRIAILQRPVARVVRAGVERSVPPEELVIGDLVVLRSGDQVVLDGRLVEGAVEVDEATLTGESEAVHKRPGDPVSSASGCLSGSGAYVVEAVGADSLANRIVATGRRFRRTVTPLQREINLVIRIVLVIVVYLEVVLVLDALVEEIPFAQAIAESTVIAGLVPNGLFVAIAITYAAAAVRIARMGALVQQANAIESLSHVDTLCLDKTGTLTANRLSVRAIAATDGDDRRLARVLGAVAASATTRNRTTEAIHAAWPAQPEDVIAEVPFASAHGWSGVALAAGSGATNTGGSFVIGAPSVVLPQSRGVPEVARTTAVEWSRSGFRVLCIAHHPDPGALRETTGGVDPVLPDGLHVLGFVALRDELRHDLGPTLGRFTDAGVSLRVISGDDPDTVSALVRQAGLPSAAHVVSGPDLAGLDGAAFAGAVRTATVFGRIGPTLKERIVDSLRADGRYVGMIGDGVNDVLPLKRADLSIAMGSGSQATRGVADLVLLDDSFSSLARAVEEGRRILNGMQAVLAMFLTRIATLGIVIVSSLAVAHFPIELRNASAITLFTVGIPSVLVALWAGSRPRPRASLGRTLLRFVAPASLVSSAVGLVVFYAALGVSGAGSSAMGEPTADALGEARTALTAFLVLSGVALIPFIVPPNRWFAVVEPPARDVRPTILAVGLAITFGMAFAFPATRTIFDLQLLEPAVPVVVAAGLAAWVVALRATWRHRLLERFLGLRGQRRPPADQPRSGQGRTVAA